MNKLKIYLWIFASVCFLNSTSISYAQPIGISISPAVLTADIKPPGQLSAEIKIKNQTSQNISYDIVMIPFGASSQKDGEPILKKTINKEYLSLFNRVEILDDGNGVKKVSLSPLQEKKLKLIADLSTDLSAGDYSFSIIFSSNTQQGVKDSVSVSIKQAAGLNVLLSVGEKSAPKGKITEFSSPKFITKGPIDFNLVVFNDSKSFFTTSGNITVKNMFDQTIGSFELKNTNILGSSERLIPASWNDGLLLGYYKATAQVALSPQGPVLTKNITFFAFPAEYLLVFIGLIIIFAYTLKRSRKRSFPSN